MGPIKLTASEWSVLDSLWQENPQTVMQLVSKLGKTVGWAKSTTITTLRRMEEKGLVRCEMVGKGKSYTPAVEQEQADPSSKKRTVDSSAGLDSTGRT